MAAIMIISLKTINKNHRIVTKVEEAKIAIKVEKAKIVKAVRVKAMVAKEVIGNNLVQWEMMTILTILEEMTEVMMVDMMMMMMTEDFGERRFFN